MRIPFVDLHGQYLSTKEEIDGAISQVIAESAYIRGRHVNAFERAWAQTLGVKRCVSCANGTDALYIALRALDVDSNIVQDTFNGSMRFAYAHPHALRREVPADVHGDRFGKRFDKIETFLFDDLFHGFVDLCVVDGQTQVIQPFGEQRVVPSGGD